VSVILDLVQSYQLVQVNKQNWNLHEYHLINLNIVQSYFNELVGESVVEYSSLVN